MSAAKDFLDELELFGKSWNYMYGTMATLRDFARSCKGENATEFDVPVDASTLMLLSLLNMIEKEDGMRMMIKKDGDSVLAHIQ